MTEKNKQNSDLDRLREDLNNLDNQLKELIKKRAIIKCLKYFYNL